LVQQIKGMAGLQRREMIAKWLAMDHVSFILLRAPLQSETKLS